MKVLLVNPDYEIERYMGRHFGRMGWVMPPMGLLYLAAQLETEGIEVEVYDAQIEDRSLATALTEARPEIVGITCATALVGSTLAAARMIKEVLPESTVVVGGVHPTVRPDDLVGSPRCRHRRPRRGSEDHRRDLPRGGIRRRRRAPHHRRHLSPSRRTNSSTTRRGPSSPMSTPSPSRRATSCPWRSTG